MSSVGTWYRGGLYPHPSVRDITDRISGLVYTEPDRDGYYNWAIVETDEGRTVEIKSGKASSLYLAHVAVDRIAEGEWSWST